MGIRDLGLGFGMGHGGMDHRDYYRGILPVNPHGASESVATANELQSSNPLGNPCKSDGRSSGSALASEADAESAAV